MQQQDHNEILDTLNQYAEQFNSMVQKILTRQAGSADTAAMFDPEHLQALLTSKLAENVQVDTSKLIENQMAFMRQQTELWQQATKAMFGEKAETVAAEERGDRRFSHSDWTENPVFNCSICNTKQLPNICPRASEPSSQRTKHLPNI